MTAPADIMRNAEFDVVEYTCHATLYGSPMRKLTQSSRTVFTAHDMPYIVKAEFGYGSRQSWNEWLYWHRTIKNSPLAGMFAATHTLKVGLIPSECWHGKPRPCAYCVTHPWYVVANVQDRVLDAGKAIWPATRKRSCFDARNLVAHEFPELDDMKDYQFVHSAKRGHGVCVDYGLHMSRHVDGVETLEPALWDAHVADMHIGEWRLFEEPNNDIIPA